MANGSCDPQEAEGGERLYLFRIGQHRNEAQPSGVQPLRYTSVNPKLGSEVREALDDECVLRGVSSVKNNLKCALRAIANSNTRINRSESFFGRQSSDLLDPLKLAGKFACAGTQLSCHIGTVLGVLCQIIKIGSEPAKCVPVARDEELCGRQRLNGALARPFLGGNHRGPASDMAQPELRQELLWEVGLRDGLWVHCQHAYCLASGACHVRQLVQLRGCLQGTHGEPLDGFVDSIWSFCWRSARGCGHRRCESFAVPEEIARCLSHLLPCLDVLAQCVAAYSG